MTELIRTKLEKKQEWEDEWTEKYIIHCFWKEAFSHDVDVLLGLSYPTVSTFFIPLLQCCIGFTVCGKQIIMKLWNSFKRLKQLGRPKRHGTAVFWSAKIWGSVDILIFSNFLNFFSLKIPLLDHAAAPLFLVTSEGAQNFFQSLHLWNQGSTTSSNFESPGVSLKTWFFCVVSCITAPESWRKTKWSQLRSKNLHFRARSAK